MNLPLGQLLSKQYLIPRKESENKVSASSNTHIMAALSEAKESRHGMFQVVFSGFVMSARLFVEC